MIDELSLIVTAIVVYFWFLRQFRGRDRTFLLIFTVFYLYMTGVIFVTILPIPIVHFGMLNPRAVEEINWNPLRYKLLDNSLLNILLTIPLGFLAPLLSRKHDWAGTLRLGLIVGLSIETIQLCLRFLIYDYTRVVDTADVIFNFFGVILGYLVFRILLTLLQKKVSPEKVRPGSLLDELLRRGGTL